MLNYYPNFCILFIGTTILVIFLLTSLNALINPILYTVFNTDFRTALLVTIRKTGVKHRKRYFERGRRRKGEIGALSNIECSVSDNLQTAGVEDYPVTLNFNNHLERNEEDNEREEAEKEEEHREQLVMGENRDVAKINKIIKVTDISTSQSHSTNFSGLLNKKRIPNLEKSNSFNLNKKNFPSHKKNLRKELLKSLKISNSGNFHKSVKEKGAKRSKSFKESKSSKIGRNQEFDSDFGAAECKEFSNWGINFDTKQHISLLLNALPVSAFSRRRHSCPTII